MDRQARRTLRSRFGQEFFSVDHCEHHFILRHVRATFQMSQMVSLIGLCPLWRATTPTRYRAKDDRETTTIRTRASRAVSAAEE